MLAFHERPLGAKPLIRIAAPELYTRIPQEELDRIERERRISNQAVMRLLRKLDLVDPLEGDL